MTHYRAIDVSGRTMPEEIPIEDRPELVWIPIARLVIDDRYQRPLLEGNWEIILRIATNFTWKRFSPVMTAPLDDGRLALIDGQHRTHAAALVGHTAVPGAINDLAPAEQAAAFAGINGDMTRVHPIQVYKAALAAGETWAVECDRVVRAAGCELMTVQASSDRRQVRQVYSVSAIRQMVEAGHGEIVTRTLTALSRSCFGANFTEAWTNETLKPLLSAAIAVPDVRLSTLVGFFDSLDLVTTNANAARIRTQPGYSQRSHMAVFTQLLTAMLQRWHREGGIPR
ncbi:ParB/Srx family N-terminal domain-containing protein [Limimaricola pyoseonensis]|uniref:ParB-like nuclease domain-containing protein n=1 Tax=Limimaricola pyoseonensis TaxID=521013 RepID=A0A1G7GRA9_9RHOB|nr:ParB/Srx family N-terminal domain-containing protein [Limimaricola pyoseonensis]SDE90690.1 hypothetical protein SAMN04488567_2892 [Limimaricola pyoseonensis]